VEVSKVSGRACPILFSVRESQAVISWELPQVYSDPDSSEKYKKKKIPNCFFSDLRFKNTLNQIYITEAHTTTRQEELYAWILQRRVWIRRY
jgi:hypothetical protein